jgi:hypothetical protein
MKARFRIPDSVTKIILNANQKFRVLGIKEERKNRILQLETIPE